jgi:hypothetical protein
VRRDFQMLVVDACPEAEAPKIVGKKLNDATFTDKGQMTVSFSNTITDADRCIQVKVSDKDALKEDDGFKEKIKIKAIALNFKKDVSGVLPPTITTILTKDDSTEVFNICFEKCPPFRDKPYIIGIIAYDDACSLPLSDTLKVTVHVTPPANNLAVFTEPVTEEVSKRVDYDNVYSWPVQAKDPDGDQMTATVLTDGFDLTASGLAFKFIEQNSGLYKAQLDWNTHCKISDFRTRTEFQVTIVVDDLDYCKYADPDTVTFNLKVDLPSNADPVIGTDLPPGSVEHGITRKVFESLDFKVFGTDADQDNELVLIGGGEGFNIKTHNISFPLAIPAKGYVTSDFSWNINCNNVNLKAKDEFEFEFIVIDDKNYCRVYAADTLKLKVKLEPPDNLQPNLTVTNLNPDIPFINNHQSILMGQDISLALNATDADDVPKPDLIFIELTDAEGNVIPEGYSFTPVQGQENITTTFQWTPECSIFKNGVYENEYTFKFKTADDRCYNIKSDSVEVKIAIRDIDAKIEEFIPPNIITPNGDDKNEFFAMVRQNKETGMLDNILPKDNCVGRFVNIVIYNRWGNQVFESNDRDFMWYPGEDGAGVYFYTVKYSNANYKGAIHLRN